MFKLTVYEIKKIFTAGKSAAAVAALMLAAFIVCYVFTGKGVSYTKDQENEILRFDAVCAEDPGALDGLEEKRRNRTAEMAAELWLRYAEELETAEDKNAVDEKYEKIFDDPSTYYTYTYSEKIDDGALISAVKELQATRRAYADGVAAVLSQAERNAKELREKYGMTPADPLYGYQIYTYNKYKNVLDNSVVGDCFVYGWTELLTYVYGDLFLFSALVMLVGAVYHSDTVCGMTAQLRTYRHGRRRLYAAKLCAVTVCSVTLSLVFSALSFAATGLRCGYSDPSVSVQNVRALALFPEVSSILSYYAGSVLMKALSAASFSAVLSLFAAAVPSVPGYYISGGALLGALVAAGRLDIAGSPALRLNLLSVCNYLPVTERLYAVILPRFCTGYVAAAAVLCAAVYTVSGVSSVFAGPLSRHRAPAASPFKRTKEKNTAKTKKYPRSLVLWEIGKNLKRTSAAALIIALFIAQITVSVINRRRSEPGREQRIYAEFILKVAQGPFSRQKERVKTLLNAFISPDGDEVIRRAGEKGLFDPEQTERVLGSFRFITDRGLGDGFSYTAEVYERNEKLFKTGVDAEFADVSVIGPLLTADASYPLYAVIMLVCIGAWTTESYGKNAGGDSVSVMAAAKYGRKKTVYAKLLSAVAVSAAAAVLFYGADLLIMTAGRHVTALNVPLCSIEAYAYSGIGMKTGEFLIAVYAGRFAASVLFAVFTVSAAYHLKTFPYSFGAVAAVTLIPSLLYVAGLGPAGFVSFAGFFAVNKMMTFSAGTELFGSPYAVFIIYAALFFTASAALCASSFMSAKRRDR